MQSFMLLSQQPIRTTGTNENDLNQSFMENHIPSRCVHMSRREFQQAQSLRKSTHPWHCSQPKTAAVFDKSLAGTG